MQNPTGTPIWYELMTPDPDASKAFYDKVVGWKIEDKPSGEMDYRMISGPNGLVGGVMRLDAAMQAEGAKPSWVIYFGVADVDATAEKAKSLGASIFVPPHDIPGVGRFSFMADPQGALFYIMRGNSDEPATVFARGAPGLCGWNELWAPDVKAGIAFYEELLGLANTETMDMGPMGGYHFLDVGETRIGAAAGGREGAAQWNAYFNVADLDTAIEAVTAGGGRIDLGPHDVPTGERIVMGTDPQGASFALVGPQKG